MAADGAESAARARAGEGITSSGMDQDKERKVLCTPPLTDCEGGDSANVKTSSQSEGRAAAWACMGERR